MAGTRQGGLKTAEKIKAKDPNHWKRIGALGGARGRGQGYQGGFAHPDANPSAAGYKGGKARRKQVSKEVK